MRQSTESQIETNQNNDDSPIAFVSMLVLIFVLLISEVRPITALITVAVVSAQTFVGLTVSDYKFDAKIRINASNLFFGFFYGSIIHVILDQVLRTNAYRVLVLPLLSILAIIYKSKELVALAKHRNLKKFTKSFLWHTDVQFVMLLLVLIPLCQVWSWSRNAVVILLFAYLVYSRKYRWMQHKVLMAPTLFVVVIASRMRPSYWWLPGWGIDESAILARAIYNWGPKGDVLLAGIPLKYQWLSYSWMGLMSQTTSSKDFEFVSRSSYVICVLAVVLAIYAIGYEITQNQKKSVIASFIVVTFSTAISYPVNYTILSINYQPFAVVSLLCWILVLLKWMKNPTKCCSIQLSVVGVICISAKSVHLVPIVGIIGTIALIAFLKKDRRKILGASLTVGISFLYTQLYFPSQTGTGLKPMFADFTRQFGVSPEVSSMKSRVLMLVIVIAALSTPTVMMMSIPTRYRPLRDLKAPLLIYLFVSALLALTLKRISSTELHFLQMFVLISLVLFASSLSDVLEKLISKNFFTMTLMVFLILALPLMVYSNAPAANDEAYVVLLLKVNFVVAIFLIFLGVIAKTSLVGSREITNQRQNIMAVALALACCANFIFVASTRDIRPISRVAATYQLGQQSLQEVANWINQNTSINSIVATNLFFGEGGTDNCDASESDLMYSISNQALNTNYYTPVAVIHRRFLVAGIQNATISYEDSVMPRIQASLRPACFPDGTSRKQLERFGVNFYVGYRTSITKLNYWSNLGVVVYQNSLYTVIELK